MRHENLPDWAHDKVTWKRSRNLLTRRRNNVTLRRGGDVPQRRYWVFHLVLTGNVVETYWWDVKDTYHWGVLVTYHWDVVGCFIWDLFETSGDALMGRRCYVLLRRRHDVLIRCRGDVPLRRLGDVPRRRCWVFHLRRNCDVAETYRETSFQRRYDVLLPGGYIHTYQYLLIL